MQIFCSVFGMLIVVAFTLADIGCGASENIVANQQVVSNTATGPHGDNGPLNGTVVSDGDSILVQSEMIEDSIKRTNLTKLWLVYQGSDSHSESRIEVPAGAMSALDDYFKAYLRYCFIDNPKGPEYAPDDFNVDVAFMKTASKAFDAVTNFEIDAADGPRKISSLEAHRLVEFVSIEAVRTWKSSKVQ